MIDPAVEQAFFEILDLPAGERVAALAELDPLTRKAVASLLEAEQRSDSFFAAAVQEAATEAWRQRASSPDPGHAADGLAGVEAGSMLGPYRIVRDLGHGGMGRVLLAERADGQFEQRVAIKVVNLPERYQQRFHQERRILAQLSHPNIARLLDGGSTAGGLPYFVMDLVEDALPIDAYCARKHLKPEAVVRLFLDVLSAVDYVHRSLIVHGDLKPNNILVDGKSGVPKLVDFGIARLLSTADYPEATQTVALSLGYASPEQVTGRPVTTATDIYGFCGVLYKSLTGRAPLEMEEKSLADCLRAICEDSPQLARQHQQDVGLDLSLILDKGLRKTPAERYPSMESLRSDLDALLGGRAVSARGRSLLYRGSRFLRRRWLPVSALVLVFVTMAVALLSVRDSARKAEAEKAMAEQARAIAESATLAANQQRDRAEDMRALAEARSAEATEERENAQRHLETQRQFANAVTALLDNDLLGRNPEALKIIDAWLEAQKSAVRQDPKNINAVKLLGILHNRRCVQVSRQSPRSAEQDCLVAVDLLTRVSQAEPEDDWTHRNLLVSLSHLGSIYTATLRANQAITVQEKAIALTSRFGAEDPVRYLDGLAIRCSLADSYFLAGRLEEGARVQEEAYQIWARRPPGAVLKGQLAYLLPMSMQRMARAIRSKQPAKASEQMWRALEVMRQLAESPGAGYLEFNEYANALNTCEWVEFRKPEIALRYARKAVELSPADTRPLALDTLAWSQFRMGDVGGAVATVKEALRGVAPGFSAMRFTLERSLRVFETPSPPAPQTPPAPAK